MKEIIYNNKFYANMNVSFEKMLEFISSNTNLDNLLIIYTDELIEEEKCRLDKKVNYKFIDSDILVSELNNIKQIFYYINNNDTLNIENAKKYINKMQEWQFSCKELGIKYGIFDGENIVISNIKNLNNKLIREMELSTFLCMIDNKIEKYEFLYTELYNRISEKNTGNNINSDDIDININKIIQLDNKKINLKEELIAEIFLSDKQEKIFIENYFKSKEEVLKEWNKEENELNVKFYFNDDGKVMKK